MAQFIGFLAGGRSEVSRLGTKSSGMRAEARGWNLGGRVEMDHLTSLGADGSDIVHLYVTAGSNGSARGGKHVASFRIVDGEIQPCNSIGGPLDADKAAQ